MTDAQKRKARKWMLYSENYNACVDLITGGLNCTKLAEDCASELDLYQDSNYTIPEELFDLAVDVSEILQKRGEVSE